MFSIAAINDTESGGQWEPLAPTKEALEFHLSQTYHEGLLKLQSKDYEKARELFDAVLKDPLISATEVGNCTRDGHLLQLRFLVLKNLATVFLHQGSTHYENALGCYLQAVEIDANDSVVWNQLGTLSCTMGLLSTSRWAFEQGLLCSPNNWNCMEKLLEVLIAIRDEVACLSIANLILRHWPSHSRALHVRKTIEDVESLPFAPRGVDKLEPKHIRLIFSNKRKLTNGDVDGNTLKKVNHNIEICLSGTTWKGLADGILNVLISHDKAHQLEIDWNCNSALPAIYEGRGHNDVLGPTDVKVIFKLPQNSEFGKDSGACLETTASDSTAGKSNLLKEREGCTDEEHPQERRSTRLERLRTRKPEKGELGSASVKDLAKVVFQFLEPYILRHIMSKDHDIEASFSGASPQILTYSNDREYNDVIKFINAVSKNYGAYHVGHLLLEQIAHIEAHQNCSDKVFQLEKATRHWPTNRTPVCNLFLTELYYESAMNAADDPSHLDFLSEASYHLGKVVELVALDFENDVSCTSYPGFPQDAFYQNRSISVEETDNLSNVSPASGVGNSNNQESNIKTPLPDYNSAFWIRFFWMSACLSLSSGCTTRAFRELCVCLSAFKNHNSLSGSTGHISLPHCKLLKWLNYDRVLHQINLLKIGELMKQETGDMIKKGMYKECIDLLAPILLSAENVHPNFVSGEFVEKGAAPSELLALDVLSLACERREPIDICTFLKTHRRKLQLLCVAAGIIGKPKNEKLMPSGSDIGSSLTQTGNKDWIQLVAHEVKGISSCASLLKNLIDQSDAYDVSCDVVGIIADIQSMLLKTIYFFAETVLAKNSPGSGISVQNDQMETQCLVDAAIGFCKLQHLDPSVSIKNQVDLIASVHDLLAEYGLCCAGTDDEGKEGTFLKLAIKHLLSLDVKLKSNTPLPCEGLETKQDTSASCEDHEKAFTCQNKSKPINDVSAPGTGEYKSQQKSSQEEINTGCSAHEIHDDAQQESVKDVSEEMLPAGRNRKINISDLNTNPHDSDREQLELGIDNALDQSIFCLYGLDLKSSQDSSYDDDLSIHKNTNRGDYQTKEQCADVFKYILPYAKVASRAGIVKLRRVLRAIRKHFPQPPDDVLTENVIDKFLDSPELSDDMLYKMTEANCNHQTVMNLLYSSGRGVSQKISVFINPDPYVEVYSNLYFFIAQAEEVSATDKFAGFVLTREGAEFIEQNANLFKYDLVYNPLHFESWQKLANIYDEEVDLLLNDGSKHINVADWGKNATLTQRVERGRRRSRRCLLMSLALAETPIQQSQIHELLGLVYYDSLQNVVPFYDQRSFIPRKDTMWFKYCQNSLRHFEKAFELKPDWIHAFYLGKLYEKIDYSSKKAFSYYSKAISLNTSAVDPYYRMHASRLKLLYKSRQDIDALKTVALYSSNQSTKELVSQMFGWIDKDFQDPLGDVKDCTVAESSTMKKMPIASQHCDEAWRLLYNDCLSALVVCTEGELKHYHKARYMRAKGLNRRSETGDLERAKDELSFCFKSSRSTFTINMWEIDGMVRKVKRKIPGLGGGRRSLEVALPESSRKFITCIRRYILLYLNLLEKLKDTSTLERAYVHLKTDRRFSLSLGDITPVALGRYVKALILSISHAETVVSDVCAAPENHLEKLFYILMDHVNLWADIGNLPEVKCPELSQSSLYGFIHEYIHTLECGTKLDALEGINEKLRKRFKSPKLASINSSKICKHASLAWCRSILVILASITPIPSHGQEISKVTEYGGSDDGLLLFVDVQPDELRNLPPESLFHPKDLEMKWCEGLLMMRKICIRKVFDENLETANMLLRSAYSLYKESSGTFPSGVNLYTSPPSSTSQFLGEEPWQPGKNGIEILDLSIPRKLLLWAYTLVHGHYSNILFAVKFCEENVKSKFKRGSAASSVSPSTPSPCGTAGSEKERHVPEDRAGVHSNLNVVQCGTLPVPGENSYPPSTSSQLYPCKKGGEPEITEAENQENNSS